MCRCAVDGRAAAGRARYRAAVRSAARQRPRLRHVLRHPAAHETAPQSRVSAFNSLWFQTASQLFQRCKILHRVT